MTRIFTALFILCLCVQSAFSQSNGGYTSLEGATEFAIPVSPAFDLLGINPNQVARPANIRDIKVDWSFRSWRLKPNLALQAQPVWEIMYNRPNLSKYRKANKWMQTLSKLDIAAGTMEDDDLTRRLSVAVKLNLYRQRDPLLVESAFSDLETQYEVDREAIQSKIDEIKRNKRSNRMQESRDS
ncbi:MAG: hypothetical protein IPJ06_12430 [Saprospiraceae bacterium]|nr:hypothetical protein [Saprospiraceae bacterium]